MIRVTFGNNKQFDYIHYYCVPNQIGLTNKFEQTEYYPYDSIKRVEKQVKASTKQEIYQFAKKKYGMKLLNIYVIAGGVQIEIAHNEESFIVQILCDDDYIDITDFVKGSVKE